MRHIIYLFIIFMLFSCTKHATVGISIALTGENSSQGIDIRDGALLAFDDLKEISRIKYNIVITDDKNSELEVNDIDTKLLNSGVDVVLGHGSSVMTKAVLPLYNKKERLLISATATSDFFEAKDDYFFRIVGSNKENSLAIANYIIDKKIAGNIICIIDSSNSIYVNGWYNQLNETLSINNRPISLVIEYDGSNANQLNQKIEESSEALKSSGVIVFLTNAVDLVLWSQQIELLGAQPIKFSSGWAKNNYLLSSELKSVNGIIFSEMFNRSSTNPRFLRFKNNFEEKYNREPSAEATQAYEAAMLINKTFENKSSSQSLKESISSIKECNGLQGYIKFSPYGDAIRESFYIEIKEGDFKSLAL